MSYDATTDDAAADAILLQRWRPRVLPVPLAANITGTRAGGSLAAPTDQNGGGGTTPGDGGTTPGGGIIPGGGTPGPNSPNPTLPGPTANRPSVARHTVAVHLTGETTSGVAGHEIRLVGPIPGPFALRRLIITATDTAAIGQFVDVLCDSDSSTTDTATPTGTSIFDRLAGLTSLTAPDNNAGLPLAAGPYDLIDPYACEESGRYLRIHQYLTAPATALTVAHVLVVYDDLGAVQTPTPYTPTPTPPITQTTAPEPPYTPPPTITPPPPLYTYTVHWQKWVSFWLLRIDQSTDPKMPAGNTYNWIVSPITRDFFLATGTPRVVWGPDEIMETRDTTGQRPIAPGR